MSGGSFNYAYIRVLNFAGELEQMLQDSGKERARHNGWIDYHPEFAPEEIATLRPIIDQARKLAEVMRAVEWMVSGDSGLEDVREAVNKSLDRPDVIW
jgi:hypothetical protein